jgi:hypothetical protein
MKRKFRPGQATEFSFGGDEVHQSQVKVFEPVKSPLHQFLTLCCQTARFVAVDFGGAKIA